MSQAPKPTDLINRSKVTGYKDSSHSGQRLKSSNVSSNVWRDNNEGYVYGSSALKKVENHVLALQYLKEKQFIPDNKFSHSDDCYYKKNHCHIELRGGHRYLRISECSKFVLKDGKKHFYSNKFQYAYHGTHPRNVTSILQNGLLPSGAKLSNGNVVSQTNGNVYGNGVYTTKVPLYAQLYARPEKWKKYWVQTMFLVRQDPKTIEEKGREGKYTTNMIGRDDLHKLYGGLIKEEEIQFLTSEYKSIVIQALLIKIHKIDPVLPGGEYYKIAKIIDSL